MMDSTDTFFEKGYPRRAPRMPQPITLADTIIPDMPDIEPIEPADHHSFWRGIVNAALWSLPFWALAAAVIAVKFYGWMG